MRIKKAILTGGGRATRLYPITTTINKHLLPLANKPIIFRAIDKVVEAGITEIFINVNPGETELQRTIGDGGHWGVHITFYEQTGGPQGVAHIAKVAQQFIGDDPFLFYFSDNVILGSLTDAIQQFEKGEHDVMLAFSQVNNPEHFGIPVFDESGTSIVEILEKPKNPPNNLAQTGIMLFGPGVYFKAFDNITKSARGEYEISDINNYLLKHEYRVGWREITGWWKDTGQPIDLITASRLLLEGMPVDEFTNRGTMDSSSRVDGNVKIGAGTIVGPGTTILGPSIIAENCVFRDCVIGPHASISQGCEIYRANVRDSIILDNAIIDAQMDITESIIGKHVKITDKKDGREHGRRMILGDKTIIEI